MTRRLFVDVAQFVDHPRATGIQRTLLFLARHWPADDMETDFGFLSGNDRFYAVAPLPAFREVTEWIFGNLELRDPIDSVRSEEIRKRLSRQATDRIDPHEIAHRYDGYLLPEFTFNDRILDTVDVCAAGMGPRCLAMVYDALPQTHPEFYNWGHRPTARYFLTIARLESLAFISASTRRLVEGRLRRSPVPNAIEVPLGADSMGRGRNPAPAHPHFVVVGTVEPRKRHQLILDTFERLWDQGHRFRLSFLGRAGTPPSFVDHLRRRAAEQGLFEFRDNATDAELRDAVCTASAEIFASEAEGYGLPPLEALALGCPVIVPAGLPSFERLSDAGQVRLTVVSEENLAAAVRRLADPSVNNELRAAIAQLALPDWRRVVADLVGWVQHMLNGYDRR